ncbi:MAG TPA: FTR1 family protein, partial [Flavobacteriaceae bacterium]|nr:FTR1 family protein [Flavobacteriaceae bacterium]
KKFVAEIEAQMFQVRQVLSKDKGIAVFETEMEKAFKLIEEAEGLLQDQQLNFWLTFLIAGSIFLREGLEAFLILAVILALIRSANAKQALPWLHGGWITAVIAGIAGWFASDYILQFGGKNREVMEGVISLVAVLVLVYVGFWLHSKSSAKQWTKFIKEKVEDLLKTEKMFGLAVFSFVIVFREAFEVILFLQAIKLEAGPENQTAIGFGVIAAVVVIALIAYLFLKYSKMISVRKLFRYSSWIILLLAIILTGKGIHSLQESGWIDVTGLPDIFRVDWLGIYPTLQTIAAQLILIGLFVVIYFVNKKNQKEVEVA